MSNASHRSAALDDHQRLVRTTGIPGVPIEQLTNNERRRSSHVYAEAISGVMKDEVEAWGEVGNRATQALAGVCANVRVVLGYGLVGLARIAVALAQDPSEGWRIGERRKQRESQEVKAAKAEG